MWSMPIALFSGGVLFFLIVACLDIYRIFIIDRENRFESIYGNTTNFFSRLSSIERKSWLATETYNRNLLGYKTISDYTYEKLKYTPTTRKSLFSLDPPNYSILSSALY